MTGPEHYRQAERHLSGASHTNGRGGHPVDPVGAAHHLAMAQVHATLALAAATALSNPDRGSATAHVNADSAAWREAAGVPSKNSEPAGNVW
ncbi:hypothetical protein [Streptomyces sp. cg35]|uniref:hypothetical protein n=1 Tax=Streptomyces sp. cg35 TaxID=3421650 RepID=UPI003D16B195